MSDEDNCHFLCEAHGRVAAIAEQQPAVRGTVSWVSQPDRSSGGTHGGSLASTGAPPHSVLFGDIQPDF